MAAGRSDSHRITKRCRGAADVSTCQCWRQRAPSITVRDEDGELEAKEPAQTVDISEQMELRAAAQPAQPSAPPVDGERGGRHVPGPLRGLPEVQPEALCEIPLRPRRRDLC